MTISETPARLGAADTPPLASGSVLLGSARALRSDMLRACERAFREGGDVVRFAVGPPGLRREMWMLFHPDGAQRVLAGNAANYRKDNLFYAEVRDAFGDGLLTSQDEEWQRQKRFLQPLFTQRRVNGYAAAMGDQIADLSGGWRARPPGVVDLHEAMTHLTLKVVCRVLFGNDVDQVLPVVRRAFGPLGESVRRRAMGAVRTPLSWPTGVNRQLVRTRRMLHGVCDEIIADRRARGSGGPDLLGLLVDARDSGAALSDAEVRDQVLVFLLAGHETTSTALTYTLHLLGRHPQVQDRIRAEAATVDAPPAAEQAMRLTYTTMVLKEAMRLYPSAPAIGRRSVADDEVGGYRIPAGTDVMLMPWVTHRHPQFWDGPERFDPERFAPEREKARHRYAWFPFGGGPRACIGQYFSMLESTIALATLVGAFTFEAVGDEPPCTNHITLRPTQGVPSLVTPCR